MASIIRLIKSAWRNLTVEMYLFLFFLAFALQSAAAFPLFYAKICRTMYNDGICSNLSSNPEFENRVQFASSEWTAFIELGRFVPSLVGAVFLGGFGDRYSTKLPVLISLAFMTVYMSSYTALVTFDRCPLYAFVLTSAALGFGGPASFITCAYSYLAKRVNDERKLTFRYAILTAFWSAAYVVAGNAAPFLYAILSYQYVMLFGQAVMALTFLLAILFYPNEDVDITLEKPIAQCPNIQNIENAVHAQQSVSTTDSGFESKPDPPRNSLKSIVEETIALYRSAWKTITKPRSNYGRAILILLCLIGVAYGSEDSGLDTVTNLFAFKRPLSWTPSLLAIWSAAMSLIQMTGSLIGAYVFQRYDVSNSWILFAGLSSACLKMMMQSIAKETWMMFVALALGALSTVGFSALRAYVAQLGTQDETGELLGCLTATSSIIPVFSVLLYNSIYDATLHVFDGATFSVCAALMAVCALAILCMNAYFHRARR